MEEMAADQGLGRRLLNWLRPTPRPEDERRGYRRHDRPLHFVVVALVAILTIYVGMLIRAPGSGVAALTVSLACAAVGSLLGFVFAIPKRTDIAVIGNKSGDANNGNDTPDPSADQLQKATIGAADFAYRPNTSLEEISDWLTKIIIGLGLVQAQEIGRFIQTQGAMVAPVLFGSDQWILGSATLIAMVVLPFLASFLYFRLYLAEEFTRSDIDAHDARQRAALELERARRQGRAQEVAPRKALEAMTQITGTPLAGPVSAAIERKLAAIRDNSVNPTDPIKGLFGGKSGVDSPGPRQLSATVKPVLGRTAWYQIDLLITSEEPKLTGDVIVFYHPTFPQSYERVGVTDGHARLRIFAYGAFTVGVLADDGQTELELDLATLPDAPKGFRES